MAHGDQLARLLRTANDDVRMEVELPEPRSNGPCEHASLERGDSQVAVEVRAPRQLVGFDLKTQDSLEDLESRGCAIGRAPVRQVVGQPLGVVEGRPVEVVFEYDLLWGPVEDAGVRGGHAGKPRTDAPGRGPVGRYRAPMRLVVELRPQRSGR